MKVKTLILSVVTLTYLGLGINTSAQKYTDTTPGLLLSGSCNVASLPKTARNFLNRHFKGIAVKKCTHDYAEAVFKVKLTNGVDIEFGNDGKVIEIESAKHTCLTDAIIKETVPPKMYKYLKENKVADHVESIEFSRGRVIAAELAIKGPDTMIFDLDGTFLVIED